MNLPLGGCHGYGGGGFGCGAEAGLLHLTVKLENVDHLPPKVSDFCSTNRKCTATSFDKENNTATLT